MTPSRKTLAHRIDHGFPGPRRAGTQQVNDVCPDVYDGSPRSPGGGRPTVEQARRAAGAGVDVISARGTESGGFSGSVSTMAPVPQVVDAVRPLPVLASGGVADGRGIAAAPAPGAQG
ncbi:nitronate monooxygenase [Streptomyces sp. NPDC053367]|uniref:nitronate monooxygenase n=1 Tax=Streptomyces sp. NPDC053367 TaxID=3365700 RepID=UPI0037D41E81